MKKLLKFTSILLLIMDIIIIDIIIIVGGWFLLILYVILRGYLLCKKLLSQIIKAGYLVRLRDIEDT